MPWKHEAVQINEPGHGQPKRLNHTPLLHKLFSLDSPTLQLCGVRLPLGVHTASDLCAFKFSITVGQMSFGVSRRTLRTLNVDD
ncbi:hypothetical protein GN956_G10428 [Arapaima gigas]